MKTQMTTKPHSVEFWVQDCGLPKCHTR